MKDIKEIGKVIKINDYSEDGLYIKETRKIVMDDKEYIILPLSFGDYAALDSDKEELVAKVKQDLFKELEKYIEIFVNNDHGITHKRWAKASLVIIANEDKSEAAND